MIALNVNSVSKQWNGAVALKNLSLEVLEGEFYALLGPNGAGKSTLIGIISSLISQDTGTISLFGKNQAEHRLWCKRQIGIVPQEFNFNMWEPVEEIVATNACLHGSSVHEGIKKARAILQVVGLGDKFRAIAKNLSGGMKRRLMIARAMVSDPKFLILDEPTAGVDIEIRHSIWDYLTDLNLKGTTVLLTTHYLEEAEKLCQQVGFINHGVIKFQGPMSEVSGLLKERVLKIHCSKNKAISLQDPLKIIEQNDHSITMHAPQSTSYTELCAILSSQGVEVRDIKPQRSDLEEVFLRMSNDAQ